MKKVWIVLDMMGVTAAAIILILDLRELLKGDKTEGEE